MHLFFIGDLVSLSTFSFWRLVVTRTYFLNLPCPLLAQSGYSFGPQRSLFSLVRPQNASSGNPSFSHYLFRAHWRRRQYYERRRAGNWGVYHANKRQTVDGGSKRGGAEDHATQAQDMIAKGNALVLDVRDAPELEKTGKIAGAVHHSRGMLEFRADPKISPYFDRNFSKDKVIIVYCASGGRSALAGKLLKDMGYDQVHNLGAFKDWAENGGAIEKPIDMGM